MKKSTAKSKPPFVDRFYRLLSTCSLGCLFRISRLLAYPVAYSRNQLSRYARLNLQLCFPELSEDRRKEMMLKSLQHTGSLFFELAALWYHPLPQLLGHIRKVDADPEFEQSRKGRIIIAPHHGSWEMLNLWVTDQSEVYGLYKASSNERLNQYVMDKRARFGTKLAATSTSGLRSLLQALKNGASCIVLPDQKPARKTAQVYAPFFGYQVRTSLLIKGLAKKSDCDIFIAAAIRDLDNASYRIKLRTLEREQILADDEQSASYLNQAIEEFIASDICQYQWSYRRFEEKEYRGLAKS